MILTERSSIPCSYGIPLEKSDTYVFEDLPFALNTAKTDGFPTVGVYDRHEAHQDELKELSDYYIRDFTDPILKTI